VVGQEVAVGGVLQRRLDDAVAAQAVDEVARRRDDEADVMGDAMTDQETENVAFEER